MHQTRSQPKASLHGCELVSASCSEGFAFKLIISPFQTISLNSVERFQKTDHAMSDFTYSHEYILIFWPSYIHTKPTVEWAFGQQQLP